MAHVFDGKLYFTRDYMQGNFIPKNLKVPKPKPTPKPQAKACSKASSSGERTIRRRISKPNICRLLMLHCLWEHGCEPEISCSQYFLVISCLWEHGWRLRCTDTMQALMCVLVVVCVVCKLWPCLSYSRCRDRINLGLLRSLYKGVGVRPFSVFRSPGIVHECSCERVSASGLMHLSICMTSHRTCLFARYVSSLGMAIEDVAAPTLTGVYLGRHNLAS